MKTGKRGFTLIELIVVIAVLAILALLIVPKVTGYVDQANDTVAKANAKTCYNEYLAWKTAKDSGLSKDTGYYPSDFKEWGTSGAEKGCSIYTLGSDLSNVFSVVGPTINKKPFLHSRPKSPIIWMVLKGTT